MTWRSAFRYGEDGLEYLRRPGIKALILYFSGTGNTRYLAHRIREGLPESMEGSLLSLEKARSGDLPGHDLLFLGHPVYETDAPVIVRDFLDRLPRVNGKGAFLFCSQGGVAGNAPRRGLLRLRKAGYVPLGCLAVGMGDTLGAAFLTKESPLIRLMEGRRPSVDRAVAEFLGRFVRRLAKYPQAPDFERFKVPLPVSIPGFLLGSIWRSLNRSWTAKLRSSMYADASCTRCGLCEETCPAQAVRIENDGIRFGQGCFLCGRCVNSCPAEAIQLGKGTVRRYRWKGYPEIGGWSPV